jgi:DNA-binding response OmpR family regulator
MLKIMLVDDDDAMRGLLKKRLSDTYEIIDTRSPEQALALALEHKPDAILLDLMMPKFSGFELCQNLRNVSYTALTPLFVITGESAAQYKEHCQNLGATAYFEKPVNFTDLKRRLGEELQNRREERRVEVRVRMRVELKLKGIDASGASFEDSVATENVSAAGFLSNCSKSLTKDTVVEVFLVVGGERLVGKARVVRKEAAGAPWQRYGFQFVGETFEWVLHRP